MGATMGRDAVMHRVCAVFLALLATAIVWQFHDRTWWPPDDGAYAHIADRMIRGEVLNGAIYDIHLGLVHFIHAAAFGLFGDTLVALRYPLALLTVIQCLIVFRLFRDRDWLTALAAGIAMATLSFVQFLNPTANWYALFATIVLIAVATGAPPEARWRYGVLGALVMVVIMFRQLTGALVAIGLVTWLLTEATERSDYRKPWLGRALLVLCGLVLGAYLLRNASAFSVVLFGLWPIGLILAALRHCVMADRAVLRMAGQMLLGAGLAIAPLLGYHAVHGSLASWVDDTVLTAFRLSALPFIAEAHFYYLPLLAVKQAVEGLAPSVLLNAAFWIALLLAPVLLGLATVVRSGRRAAPVPPLAHLAVFYALVSAHYEIPIYLFYTAALTLCGLLALGRDWTAPAQRTAGVIVLMLAAVGLWSHAGQPVTRGYAAIAAGARVAVERAPIGYRVGLRIAPGERAFYDWIIPLIDQYSGPGDSIFALPVNPELYFMTGRRNPTRFFNSALGVHGDADVQALLSALAADPPAMLIVRPDDKYMTREARRIVEELRPAYRRIDSRDGVDVYVRRL